MNERDKMIKKIMSYERGLFIATNISPKEDLEKFEETRLKKYLRACEILDEHTTIHSQMFIPCVRCGKYMANTELKRGDTCFDCQGIAWFPR